MRIRLDDLPEPERLALTDMVLKQGLLRTEAGYGEQPGHAPHVIDALQSRELCRVWSLHHTRAVPSKTGWNLVRNALKRAGTKVGTFPTSLG